MTKQRILILGAGFGGLELGTLLSEALGDALAVTLIDRADAFILGYSKLDVMFGRETEAAVRLPYSRFAKPGSASCARPSPRSILPRAGS